jgi:hypothetical protein
MNLRHERAENARPTRRQPTKVISLFVDAGVIAVFGTTAVACGGTGSDGTFATSTTEEQPELAEQAIIYPNSTDVSGWKKNPTYLATSPAFTVPAARLASGGLIVDAEKQLSCAATRALFGMKPATLVSHYEVSTPIATSSCQQFVKDFAKGPNGRLEVGRSVKITDTCSAALQSKFIVITAPNVHLDCNNNVFHGEYINHSKEPLGVDGLSLIKNPADSGARADGLLADGTFNTDKTMPIIRDVTISNCGFVGYARAGIYLSNRYNRNNPLDQAWYQEILGSNFEAWGGKWDLPGAKKNADAIRDVSPSDIHLHNVVIGSTASTGNYGIFVTDHLQSVDIDGATIVQSEGIYLDHGTRKNVVRNSCFYGTGYEGRESIAIDASAQNEIRSNLFYQNPYGSIKLYKNCSEGAGVLPQQFFRRQPANENIIDKNLFVDSVKQSDYGHGQYRGISVASRESTTWGEDSEDDDEHPPITTPTPISTPTSTPRKLEIAGHKCSDPFLMNRDGSDMLQKDQTTIGGVATTDWKHLWRDYSQYNQITNNVFITLGVGVTLNNDYNSVVDNIFYRHSSWTNPVISVGNGYSELTVDPDTGKVKNKEWRSACHVEISGNQIQLYDKPSATASADTVEGLFHTDASGTEHGVFHNNSFQGLSLCREPFLVNASNVASAFCLFPDSGSVKIHLKGDQVAFTDGGQIHGKGDFQCTSLGRWLALSTTAVPTPYCCSGAGCTPVSIANKYYQ